MATVKIERGDGWELRLADCFDDDHGIATVAGIDHVAADPPYGKRTHSGQRHARATGYSRAEGRRLLSETGDLGYKHWTPQDVGRFVERCESVCDGWVLSMTSHDLIGAYEDAFEAVKRYSFAPVVIVIPGMNVRLSGDGPSNWAVYLMVSRRRRGRKGWSTKRGAYTGFAEDPRVAKGVKGAKPLSLMEAILRDYTKRGELVADPCAGSGTTGVAAVRLGRRFIGWEKNEDRFAIALERLRDAKQLPRDLFEASAPGEQVTGGMEAW